MTLLDKFPTQTKTTNILIASWIIAFILSVIIVSYLMGGTLYGVFYVPLYGGPMIIMQLISYFLLNKFS